MGGIFDAAANSGKRAIQPDRNAVFFQQGAVGFLGECAAAQSHHHGPSSFHFAHALLDGFAFYFAKFLLTARIEDVGNRRPLGPNDVLVHVCKGPAQFVGEQTSDSGFTGSHETYQVNAWGSLQLKNHSVRAVKYASLFPCATAPCGRGSETHLTAEAVRVL